MEAKYGASEINSVLEKVRLFNKAIGSYQLFSINEDFNYRVKLTNGTILISVEALHDNETSALDAERLTAIAATFRPTDAQQSTPHASAAVKQEQAKKKSNTGLLIGLALAVLFLIGAAAAYQNLNNKSDKNSDNILDAATTIVRQREMTPEEKEHATPTDYLTATASFNENFWGDKIKVKGTIISSATAVTFKDAVIRITYLSKTNTELTTTEHKIYEILPPGSEVPFELKVDNYKDVERLRVEITNATAY